MSMVDLMLKTELSDAAQEFQTVKEDVPLVNNGMSFMLMNTQTSQRRES
jgi:hypothetical protein